MVDVRKGLDNLHMEKESNTVTACMRLNQLIMPTARDCAEKDEIDALWKLRAACPERPSSRDRKDCIPLFPLT